jgi:DMSO reductase anchor subunit
VALSLGLLALGASIFPLGRPKYAFRAVLGIRTSWMSRECLAFGLFAQTAVAYAALFWAEPLAKLLALPAPPAELLTRARGALGIAVATSGALGVLCSMMLYKVTARRWWSGARTTARFVLTAAVLGVATTCVTFLVAGTLEQNFAAVKDVVAWLASYLTALALAKLVLDAEILVHLRERGLGELKRTALLIVGELRGQAALRLGFGAFGALFSYVLSRGPELGAPAFLLLALLAWGSLLGGELFERTLFFRALSVPKMPGAIGP